MLVNPMDFYRQELNVAPSCLFSESSLRGGPGGALESNISIMLSREPQGCGGCKSKG